MLSRRSFLRTAAVSAAAPTILSRPARAAGANSRLNLGFIGVGTKGRGHLGSFLGRDDVQVVAVCDVVKERVDLAKQMTERKYAEKTKAGTYKGCRAFNDFRELLAVPGLDAVAIATPDHWHATAAVLAARAKLHVYCEKPLTQNVAEGRWLVDEVKKAGVVFQVGSQQRSEFGNRFRQAVEAVWNGRIGKVHTVRIGVGGPAKPCDLPAQEVPAGTDWDLWLGPAPERAYNEILCPKGIHKGFPQWRQYQEYASGATGDMGAHHFDIAQWALGTDRSGPTEVIPPADPKKGAGLTFVYASGVKMIHNVFEGDVRADCVFEGTDGVIRVSRGMLKATPDKALTEPLGDRAKRVMASSDHNKNWLEAIRAGTEPIAPVEVGHRTATVCHLANIGYRLGRKLTWDPAAERFVGDAAADKELTREPRAKWKV